MRVWQIKKVADYMAENGYGAGGRIDYAAGDLNFIESLADHWSRTAEGNFRCGEDDHQRLGPEAKAWAENTRMRIGFEEV